MTAPRQVACYLRVSTGEQTTENQRLELTRFCEGRGWSVVAWYEETISGASRKRPAFDAMMREAQRAPWRTLVVWKLDRLTRGGALAALDAVTRLDRMGVEFVSAQEGFLDTGGPFRDALLGLVATIAKMERSTLIERTHAGLRRAKAEGVKLGRPPVSGLALGFARKVLVRGGSMKQAAADAKLSVASLYRAGLRACSCSRDAQGRRFAPHVAPCAFEGEPGWSA